MKNQPNPTRPPCKGHRLFTDLIRLTGVALAFVIPILPVAGVWPGLHTLLGVPPVYIWGLFAILKQLSVVALMPTLFAQFQGGYVSQLFRAKPGRVSADLVLGFVCYAIIFATVNFVVRVTNALPPQKTNYAVGVPADPAALRDLPFAFRVALPISNGISEELGSRAYTILTLEQMGVPSIWSAAIAYACSVAQHVPYWGLDWQILLAQAVFVLLYLYRRSLVASSFAHILADAFPMIIIGMLPHNLQHLFLQ